MIPGMNPKLIKQAMKKMGMKQEEIDARQVIIQLSDRNIIISNPSVLKVNMMGQETFQISGDIQEETPSKWTEEDVKLVAEQAGCPEKDAIEALEKAEGDIAQAIINLKEQ